MKRCQTWFTHKGVYSLPDGTRMIAIWTELGDCPRWWFVAEQGQRAGQWGELLVVVYANGSIYNFVPEMDGAYPTLYHPQPSDLCIEDIYAVEHEPCYNNDSDCENA
jgi:hypothetical protein